MVLIITASLYSRLKKIRRGKKERMWRHTSLLLVSATTQDNACFIQ
jgi:hypothetical protein